MYEPMVEMAKELDDWEGASSGTEQSFRTAHAAIPPMSREVPRKASRKARFIERFESVKLTKENLSALQAGYKRVPAKADSPADNHFHFNPSPGTEGFRISRKPLADSAREALQKLKDETAEATQKMGDDSVLADDLTFPDPARQRRSCSSRSNTDFTDFLPYHQIVTWQQIDNEEWQRRQVHSIPALAFDGMKRLSSSCDGLSTQSKRTASQLKEVISKVVERGRLDRDS
jgi:hypothetical protein